MKLMLINPWDASEEGVKWTPEYQKFHWRNAYYGLVLLGTYARSLGHEVLILDGERDLLLEAGGNPRQLLHYMRQKVREFEPEVVGVTGMSCRYPVSHQILRMLGPMTSIYGFKLILGGHHARGAAEDCLQDHPQLDCLFYGWSEVPLRKYLAGHPRDQVPGIMYRDGSQVVRNPPETVQTLEELPFPDWSLIDTSFYTHPCVWLHRSTQTLVKNLDTFVSRGCSFTCNYCAGTGKLIWQSLERTLDYLRYIKMDYQVNATMFQDSSLGNNLDFVYQFCDRLLTTDVGKGLVWNANIRADQVSEDLVRLMHRAGCRMLFIGYESASDRILKAMAKATTFADNQRCAAILEKVGMPYWASFIAGYPGETAEDLLQSIRFAESINPLGGWANEFNPAPGSRAYQKLLREGRLEKPTTPQGWAAISSIGKEGLVGQGHWSAMDPLTFRHLTDRFQQIMQAKLDNGVQRELVFPA